MNIYRGVTHSASVFLKISITLDWQKEKLDTVATTVQLGMSYRFID